eukprot:9612836-Heterocapsa_arctica.AAC.1
MGLCSSEVCTISLDPEQCREFTSTSSRPPAAGRFFPVESGAQIRARMSRRKCDRSHADGVS